MSEIKPKMSLVLPGDYCNDCLLKENEYDYKGRCEESN